MGHPDPDNEPSQPALEAVPDLSRRDRGLLPPHGLETAAAAAEQDLTRGQLLDVVVPPTAVDGTLDADGAIRGGGEHLEAGGAHLPAELWQELLAAPVYGHDSDVRRDDPRLP